MDSLLKEEGGKLGIFSMVSTASTSGNSKRQMGLFVCLFVYLLVLGPEAYAKSVILP